VRHVEGQQEPELQYDQTIFLQGLEMLKKREYKYGTMMKNFTPGVNTKDPYDKIKTWHLLNDLHETTKYNLEQFEKPDFQLEKSARGTKEVTNLVRCRTLLHASRDV
jgi:hypothetical protein